VSVGVGVIVCVCVHVSSGWHSQAAVKCITSTSLCHSLTKNKVICGAAAL